LERSRSAAQEVYKMRDGFVRDGFSEGGSVVAGLRGTELCGFVSAILGWLPLFAAVSWSAPGASAAPPQGVSPNPGDISISEILFNPATPIDDNDGEYFEVTNISTKALDFAGLYIQDSQTPGSTSAPYVQLPAGSLPLLYPGESFVFARSGEAALNGAIPKVDYVYSVPTGGIVPVDKSKVSHTAMALSNSSIDSLAITTGAPMNLGGFVIEAVTYDPTKAPFTTSSGIAFERADLYAGWLVENLAPSSGSFGTVPQSGTPGAVNSNDATLYSTWYKHEAVNPQAADTGTLLAKGPASVHRGTADLTLSGGAPLTLYALGISEEQSASLLFDGTCLIDLSKAFFWALPSYQFDAAGAAALSIPLTPELVGQQFWIQWFGYDFAASKFTFSNALGVDVIG
jgi:hypothetical protein